MAVFSPGDGSGSVRGSERHEDTAVTFYIKESFTFRVTEPDTATALTR